MSAPALSRNSVSVRGSVTPRISTAPLAEGPSGECGCGCALSRETSYGFDVDDFARDVLGQPLDAWQRWVVIHAGELLPDGRPRFRKILIVVARQNGKTHLLKVLSLYWMYVDCWPLILGQSTTLSTAKESWQGAQDMALASPILAADFGKVRRDNNDPHWLSGTGAKYKIAAANRKGGRGLSCDRLVIDELREHRDWVAWNAALPTMNARPYAQAFLITNQGDDQSVVLASLRESGIAGTDDELGLFEYSAPDGASPLDPDALAAANPNLGFRLSMKSLLADAERALQNGGEEESSFRTEIMCQRVRALDAAINHTAWELAAQTGDLTAESMRHRIALCVDLSPDRLHATLVAAAVLPDDRVRVQVVATWQGHNATAELREALPMWVTKTKARQIGWMPSGPAAALAATLKQRKGRYSWPPPGVSIEEINGEVAAMCMGFAEQVESGAVVHANEPILNAHVLGAAKLWNGDRWRFERKGQGHCDAAYAAAGAVHLARTMPVAAPIRPVLVVAS